MRVDEEQYLAHYGVLGMKWGKRKAQPTSAIKSKVNRAKSAMKARKDKYLSKNHEDDAYDKAYNDTYNKLIKSGMRKSKAEAQAFKAATGVATKVGIEEHAKYKSDMKKLKSNYKQAKKERKTSLKETFNKINKDTKLRDKLLYSEGTRKLAAKYVVDNNMTIAEATKKANKQAIKNTALILAAQGGYMAYKLYKNR